MRLGSSKYMLIYNWKSLCESLRACLIAIIVYLALGLSTAEAAEFLVRFEKSQGFCKAFTELRGEIKLGDGKNFSRFVDSVKSELRRQCPEQKHAAFTSFYVSSSGGAVDDALVIGRILRREEAWVWVAQSGECLSACVFLLAGGVKRFPLGKIGIHRPYFLALDSRLSTVEVRLKRDKQSKEIKDYFHEMDIPLSLFDAMLSVPPEKMQILSWDEVQAYRLFGDDPTHDEREVAAAAQLYGVSSAEYRKRNARALAECKTPDPICSESILHGLSMDEYMSRAGRAFSICGGEGIDLNRREEVAAVSTCVRKELIRRKR
jgi:hypothetical protein